MILNTTQRRELTLSLLAQEYRKKYNSNAYRVITPSCKYFVVVAHTPKLSLFTHLTTHYFTSDEHFVELCTARLINGFDHELRFLNVNPSYTNPSLHPADVFAFIAQRPLYQEVEWDCYMPALHWELAQTFHPCRVTINKDKTSFTIGRLVDRRAGTVLTGTKILVNRESNTITFAHTFPNAQEAEWVFIQSCAKFLGRFRLEPRLQRLGDSLPIPATTTTHITPDTGHPIPSHQPLE